jgi:hypothetical protein
MVLGKYRPCYEIGDYCHQGIWEMKILNNPNNPNDFNNLNDKCAF